MNNVSLLGRLVREPEVRYSQSNEPIAVARICIAVPRKYKKEKEANADFINCTAFNKTAEVISKYFKKGDNIAIVGEIRNNNYVDKNGEKRFSTEILISQVSFCGSKNKDNEKLDDENGEEFYNIEDNIEENNLPF